MIEQSKNIQEKVLIDTGLFTRELLEKACLEIKVNRAKQAETNKVS